MFPHQLNPGVLSNKKDLTGKGCCGLARRKAQGSEVMKIYNQRNKQSKNPKEEERMTICSKFGCASNSALLMELRKKIMTFRDIIDLPPCDGSTSTNVLVMGTVRDLQKLYPEIIRSNRLLEEKGASVDQALTHFLGALKSIGDSWMIHHGWMDKFKYDSSVKQNHHPEELGEIMLEALHCMNKTAKEKFDLMDDDHETKDRSAGANAFDKISVDSYSDSESSYCASPASPATPTSVLPGSASKKGEEKATIFANPPILWSLRIRAVGKLNQVDVKRLSLNALSSLGGHGSSTLSVNNRAEEPITRIEEKSSFGSAATSNKTGDGGNGDDITATSPEMEMLTSQSLPPPVQAPIPPLPPLMLQSNMIEPTTVTTPSPPNPPSNAATNRLHPPPPPPPPPLPSFASQTAKAAPSPLLPMMPSVGVAPPPPPPPMVPSKGVAPPPPPPPMIALNGSIASPLPMAPSNGAALPPPPPPFGTKCLRPKKSTTKLKRSSQMGNLYRLLRGKVEGSNLQGKSSNGRKSAIGASAGGKQGMADALAEMTKRSAYFQQIEEDVQKHAKSITELKSAINTFQTKDMAELIKFHKSVESILEYLTDESQVLARFEGFPVKKLEALRTAAALYSKLDAIVTELRCWKITAPLNQQFDKVERYFTKIKAEVDALERTKDEESKKFQSHSIDFDFHILIRIKEAMVDVSSSCMESALKERREAKAVENEEATPKRDKRTNGCAKLLWRAFQFAFRVYTFAGGHDDRADKLTKELAYEIENDPHNE